MFNQILPAEDDTRVAHYPSLPIFDFNLVSYLFAFEVAFFESAELEPMEIGLFEQFLKTSKNFKSPGLFKVSKMAFLIYHTTFIWCDNKNPPNSSSLPVAFFLGFFVIFLTFLTLRSHN